MKQLGQWLKPQNVIIAIVLIISFFLLKSIFWGKKLEDFSVHEGIAEIQYQAMRDYGTDEEAIFKSLEGLTKNDLIKVYKAFGLRTYTSGGKGLAIFGKNIFGNSQDLFGWYAAELTEKEREKLREIWKISGMKLTF